MNFCADRNKNNRIFLLSSYLASSLASSLALFLVFAMGTSTAHGQENTNGIGGDYLNWLSNSALTSGDGRFSIKSSGRLIYDYGLADFNDENSEARLGQKINNFEFRALELGIRGKIFGNINYRLVTKLLNNQVDIKLAYLSYSFGNFDIVVGQTRTYTALDKSTPLTNTSFSVRGAFVNAIKARTRLGVGLSTHGHDWTISGGYFIDSLVKSKSAVDQRDMITTRLTYSPSFKNGLGLHFGTSYFYRSNNGRPFDHKYNDRPFSHQGDYKPLRSAQFNILSEQFLGLEFVATYKSLATQAEFAIVKNKLSNAEILTMQDPSYKGGYFELSYFATGGQRTINAKRGRFNGIKVKNPVGAGGIGEIKIAARYDMLDLRHQTFGTKQVNYIGGIDWYLNVYMKFQLNYAHSIIGNFANVKSDTVDTFNGRFQIFW